jgi:hypothetical protein
MIAWRFVPTTVILIASLIMAATSGCNNGTGDCPPKGSIQPGAACSDDTLQCAYDLSTPSPACDGTTTTIASSCTCTKGTWVCPSAVACAGGDGSTDNDASATDESATDESATDDASAGSEGSTDDGGIGDSSTGG